MTETILSDPSAAARVDPALVSFIYHEARLADEARYSEWEALWDDDARYWVPMSPDADPETQVSYVNDNRSRIRSRVAQLNTGVRHSQTPPSVLRRTVSNFEVVGEAPQAGTVTVASNFVLVEYRFAMTLWAGRYLHTIRAAEGGLRLAGKTVHLVNAGGPIPTMAFVI
ncbi:MAG TPA: aromatic-ring-hydroxylating dioxygenase subunit beta [Trebonia sp.]|jgi:3-phenylpropionate/cinnamic acid dioxygenase small subunit